MTGGSGFIGTNLITHLSPSHEILNLDWNPPLNPFQTKYWCDCDIMEEDKVLALFKKFKPDVVIHLAARTDTDIYELDGDLAEYIQNTVGSKIILDCIKQTPSIQRAIITSSMFVCKAGYMPKHDQDYSPFTLYGVSKKLTEEYTREAGLNCIWTIIRPQTIWGPWSMRYTNVMFRVMKKGLYFHPDKANVQRAYGFSGNVTWQIEQIINATKERVHEQVFYVGDRPINLLEWVHGISHHLVQKPARVIPTSVIKGIALGGDMLKILNVPFPITSTRFNSMVQNYLTPIEKTFEVLGEPPNDMQKGISIFINWYQNESSEANLTNRKKIAGSRRQKH